MSPANSSILMPVRLSTIIASFALALFLNFLPWRDLRLMPDFVALTLCFWCIRQPRLVGLGVGSATLGGFWLYLGQGRAREGTPSTTAFGFSGRF